MNRAVDRYLSRLKLGKMAAAEISGSAHAHRPFRSHRSLNYPAFDVCAPLTLTRRFDVVICEQVLEHVVDPWAGAVNLAELCRPGGHVIVTSPFLIRVHELPQYAMYDYWRFTSRGLRLLLEKAGLDVVETGEWGNRMCVTGNLTRWSARRPWHPMGNEPDVPVQVWAFARKPRIDADD